MAKPDKSKNKTVSKDISSSSAKAKTKAESTVTSNPRLVAAIKNYEASKSQTQSYLVEIATICQEEQLTKSEIVASMIEARGMKKDTAEQQFSRMRAILTDPDALEELKSGESDLKTIRERTKNTQKNPSAKRQQENREKRFSNALATIINVAKEGAMDRETILNTIKTALKKAGIKLVLAFGALSFLLQSLQ